MDGCARGCEEVREKVGFKVAPIDLILIHMYAFQICKNKCPMEL